MGQNLHVLKWKPANFNSVDFKFRIVQEGGLGILSKSIGALYVGGARGELVLFSKMNTITK